MIAILALIEAAIEMLPNLAADLISICVQMVFLVGEFLFITVTRGPVAAKQKFVERRQTLKTLHQEYREISKRQTRVPAIVFLLIAVLMVGMLAWHILNEKLQQQRREQTERRIDRLADEFIEQIKKAPKQIPDPGPLPDRDAWGRPLEIFVDRFPVGTMIVVRSRGRDGQAGTLDDQIAIKTSTPAIDVGKDVVKFGMAKIQKFLDKPK